MAIASIVPLTLPSTFPLIPVRPKTHVIVRIEDRVEDDDDEFWVGSLPDEVLHGGRSEIIRIYALNHNAKKEPEWYAFCEVSPTGCRRFHEEGIGYLRRSLAEYMAQKLTEAGSYAKRLAEEPAWIEGNDASLAASVAASVAEMLMGDIAVEDLRGKAGGR